MKRFHYFCLVTLISSVVASAAFAAQAGLSEADQQALRTQYAGKVLIFRKPYRMVSQLEVAEDGTVKGSHHPGYWAVDSAVQVKDLEFHKDRVTFKCAKLWADVRDDGQLHYFPASAALKGKTDYPENEEVTFRVKKDAATSQTVVEQVGKVFLGAHDSVLAATPHAIAAYIQKIPAQVDFDPASGMGFSGTIPKAVSRPNPDLPREAQLVGQTGRESFVVFVDEKGNAAVTGFTHLLQYGFEEATIEAVKAWRFEPAMKDGNPVAVRIPMYFDVTRPQGK